MRGTVQHLHNRDANRCAACGGKFGLVRYYAWRTALCSKKCIERSQTREESDRRWLASLWAAGKVMRAPRCGATGSVLASSSFAKQSECSDIAST
jgi:hypothetical protein